MFDLQYLGDCQLFKVAVVKYTLDLNYSGILEKDICKNACLFVNDVLDCVSDSTAFYVEWKLNLIMICYGFTYKFKKSAQFDSFLKLSDVYFRNLNTHAIGKYRNTDFKVRNMWYF